MLLLHVERHLPLVEEGRSPWRRRSAPSCRSRSRPGPARCTRSSTGSRRSSRTASPASRPARAASGSSWSAAFGYQAPQSGSSATFESIPMSRRFFVMIWFEATQSDQPEITWMSSLTAVALRVVEVAALVGEPVVREHLLRGRRVVGRHRLRPCLDGGVGDPLGERPLRPMRVGRRRVAVLAELRDRVPVDREAERLAEGDEAVRVLLRVEDERDADRRRSRRRSGSASGPSPRTPSRRSGRSCASSRPGRSGSVPARRRSRQPGRTRGTGPSAALPASSARSCRRRSPGS